MPGPRCIPDDSHGVAWFEWRLDGQPGDAMAFFDFAERW